jgi:prevent-host-death family protein
MKTISISEAKATLSEQLRQVRRGSVVVITHRGKAIARIVPVSTTDADLEELESLGLLRTASAKLSPKFWSEPRPADASGSVRAAVANERADTW